MKAAVQSIAPSARLFLLTAFLLGTMLRLVWIGDIEYKYDEHYLFQRSVHAGRTEPWPWVGQPSSAQFRHPGLQVWSLLLLGRLVSADTPTELARAVQVLNILTIAGLLLFAVYVAPRAERAPWLWAGALIAVN